MDTMEYSRRMSIINTEASMRKMNLMKEYVHDYPGRLSVGDIAEDALTGERIRVAEIRVSDMLCGDNGLPQPMYRGVRVRKDGKAFVDNRHATIYHSCLVRHSKPKNP